MPEGERVVLDDRDGLSPDEAALLAIAHNPSLQAIRAQRGLAEAALVAAGVLPNPRLEGSLAFPVAGADARVIGYGAGLSWNLTPLFARAARRSGARQGREAVDLEVAWQEWQVAQAAKLHALRVIYLRRRLEVARAAESQWQQRLERLRAAEQAQALSRLAVARAQAGEAQAELSRLSIEREEVREESALAQALGLATTEPLQVDMSWESPRQLPSASELMAALPERRLDLRALRHAHESHDEALRAATIARFPAIEIGVHAAREVDGVTSAGLRLTFGIPFFDHAQAERARERALRQQVDAQYPARLAEARSDVSALEREWAFLTQQRAVAARAAAAARELADLARGAAAQGQLDTLLAADLEARAITAQATQIQMDQAAAEVSVALSTAAGMAW